MRTTINIDEHILTLAKREALSQKKSLGKVVEDALRTIFASRTKKSSRICLVTAGGAGVKAGIDLDDSHSLLEIMDK
ncbi:MAG: DUF2191 domain-containing protein [Deltaproteobacteria bacterium]|nr:DUF2191 domain-containing protein [Deltaproteobacteria bacterium]MCK5681447.1 DUF2191 domain-containing protein [bacterium]